MVPLTHASVCLSAYNVGATLALGPRDRLLNVLPLFHGHGLISGLAGRVGGRLECGLHARLRCRGLLRLAEGVSTNLVHGGSGNPSGGVIGGDVATSAAPSDPRCGSFVRPLRLCRPDVLGGLEALFGVPVIDTYGMTEAATQIAANPLRATKAWFRRPVRRGRDRDPGQRGPTATSPANAERSRCGVPPSRRGYDNDAAATASAFRDGWFRTGDLGYLDADGYLFIVGRIKDIINRGGQKVAPAEVEEALLSHPDVVEAAVFPVPHRRLGEDVAAAVVLRQDAKVSAQSLRDFARERLAGFKVPGLIRIVPEIPKGAGGKIKRGELVAALSITLPTARVERGGKMAPPRSELEWQLAEIWAELLDLNQIGIDQDVFALGADSLTVTQMISRLRARFGVDLLVQGYLRCTDRCGSRGFALSRRKSRRITELDASRRTSRA